MRYRPAYNLPSMSGTATELNALLALVERAARRLQDASPSGAVLASTFRSQAGSLRASPPGPETIERAERLLDQATASIGGERLKALPNFQGLSLETSAS